MARFAKYQLDYGVEGAATYTFFFLAPPDHYTGIETETGISKVTEESGLLDMPVTKTGELSISPVASRKTLRVNNEASGTNKYVDILINAAKANTAQNTLVGKNYKGGLIKRVLDSRKQTKY